MNPFRDNHDPVAAGSWLAAAVFAFCLWMPACSSSSPQVAPDTTAPAASSASEDGTGAGETRGAPPDESKPATPDECRAAGGTFIASTGGSVSCPEGTVHLADIPFGIEGGICCQ